MKSRPLTVLLRFAFIPLTFSVPAMALAEEPAPHYAAHLESAAVPQVMAKVVDGFILPGYQGFRDAAGAFASRMDQLCNTPSAEGLEKARAAFKTTLLQWSRVEIVRVGPVLDDNRFEHIVFYPDRKGLALKQIQSAIASNDQSFTQVAGLQGKSVAMQGLGAAEYVLFGAGSEALTKPDGHFRCLYGAAIATNLHDTGALLVNQWSAPDGIQKAWKQPGPENDVFRDAPEAVTGLLGVLVHGSETVRDERLENFYKGGDNHPQPRQAIYWRSGMTFASMQANIDGVTSLLNGADVASLLPADKRGEVEKVNQLAQNLKATLASITPDMEKAVNDPVERQKLDKALADSRQMITALSDGVGAAIGLTAGFSFADGD